MIIGVLTVRLHIYDSDSLKRKRMAIKSLKDKLRSRFNVSVAEIGSLDKWQLADIAIVNVANEKSFVNSTLSKVLNFIDDYKDADIIDHNMQLF